MLERAVQAGVLVAVLFTTRTSLLAQPTTAGTASGVRVHAHLLDRMQHAAPTERVRVVISFTDTDPLPEFPQLNYALPRNHSDNLRVLSNVQSIIEGIRAVREAKYTKKVPGLVPLGVTVESTFWLVNGIVATVPFSALNAISRRDDVTFIEEAQTDVPPPTVAGGRALINSDFLYSLSGTNHSSWNIGLLDTGVQVNHVQFVPDNRITAFDCVNGTTNYCRTGNNLNPSDDCWNHGTSSAAIMTANNAQGDNYRGVTNFGVWSYKVYPAGCQALSVDAVVRGFQAASSDRMAIVVAEMQDNGGLTGMVATAANQAFETGLAVIAANGNYGIAEGYGSVRSPAIAHRVIGVNGVDYINRMTIAEGSKGPTPDGRIKPDIEGPTDTQTAAAFDNQHNPSTTALQIFTGTSGATPYIGAAAALLGHWQTGIGTWAGDYYARIINWGSNFTDPSSNNVTGAGLLVLPSALGTQPWPARMLISSTFPTNDVPYSIPAGAHDFRAAIWWAEGYGSQQHESIELDIVDPSGVVRARGIGAGSVFQKALVTGPLTAGTWTVHVVCTAGCNPGGSRVYIDVNAQ